MVSRAFVDGRAAGELPGRSLEFLVRRFPAADNPGPLAWLPTPLCRVAGPTWLAPSDKVRLSRVEEPPVRDSALLCTRSNHSLTFSWKAADGCEAWKTFAREVDGSDDEERARAVVGPLSGTPPSAGSRFLGRKWALRLTSLRPSLHTRRSWIGGSCAFGVSAELSADSVRSKAGVSCTSRFWSSPAPAARTTAGEGSEVGEGIGDGLMLELPWRGVLDSWTLQMCTTNLLQENHISQRGCGGGRRLPAGSGEVHPWYCP